MSRRIVSSLICLIAVSLIASRQGFAEEAIPDGTPKTEEDSQIKSGPAEIPDISAKLNKKWTFEMPLDVKAGAGYMSGDETHTDQGAIFILDLGIDPSFSYRKKKLKVGLAADFSERETFGFHLPYRDISGGPFIDVRFKKKYVLSINGEAGNQFRPNWPDLYQPKVDAAGNRTGKLLATDRFSYLHAEGGANFEVRFKKNLNGNVFAEYYYQNNIEDSNYNEVDDPAHLVPGDRYRIRGGVGVDGYVGKRIWRYSIDVRTDWTQYLKTFARDAKTGLTNAAPRIRERNSFRVYKQILKAVLAVDYTRNIDVFQGYYTWNQWGGEAELDVSPVERLTLDVGYSITYKKYTTDGYQETDNHPSLDNGDQIRMNFCQTIRGGVEVSIFFEELKLFVEGGWTRNKTNFPDYEPGVFPAGGAYRINWDYVNYQIVGGLKASL
jgi:hypothetical protein